VKISAVEHKAQRAVVRISPYLTEDVTALYGHSGQSPGFLYASTVSWQHGLIIAAARSRLHAGDDKSDVWLKKYKPRGKK